MAGKLGANIPQQSIIYLLMCVTGVLIFIFFGLLPASKDLAGLKAKTRELNLRITEQKTLLPYYETLTKKGQKEKGRILPFPKEGELKRGQIEKIDDIIKNMAAKYRMSLVSVKPALASPSASPDMAEVETVVKGDFFAFRNFLRDLSGSGYIKDTGDIEIKQEPDAMEFKIIFWIEGRKGPKVKQ